MSNLASQSPPAELVETLRQHGQEHLLRWWDELDAADRRELTAQIAAVDFEEIERLRAGAGEQDSETPEARARRAKPPPDLVSLPKGESERAQRREAADRGEELLRAGRVAIVLVAGGQGTRLGFEHPKGMYPIGPVSGKTLFQVLAEQALARSRRAGAAIPYFVMTSDATHEETVAFFRAHDYFGLDPADVTFFKQGNMPAADLETGKLLLAEKGRVALSPDGHGGMLRALARAGLIEEMRRRGVDYLYYHQVDNPTVSVCDPVFLGLHAQTGSEMSTKVVAKRGPEEKMGVVVEVDGRTQIIEYSDMPPDVAKRRDAVGNLLHWAGSIAVHVFDRPFLERLIGAERSLPFHLAKKVVPYVDGDGNRIEPQGPNAWKFERFIFDALPHAGRALVLETDRAREFNPVKNAEGDDSPETARAAMERIAADWLRQACARVAEDARIEIGPLFALDAADVAARIEPGTVFEGSVSLDNGE